MDADGGTYTTDGRTQRKEHFFLAGHFTVMAVVIITIALTAYHPSWKHLLRYFTRENGLFEWGSVAGFFLLSIYSLTILLKTLQQENNPGNIYRLIFLSTAIGALLAALEEISWGQHIFAFTPGNLFTQHNLQGEINIHNFVPATLFNGIIFAVVYVCFIFLPALCRLYPATMPSYLWNLLPSTHTMLIFAFASSLQAYFTYPVTYLDTGTLWFGLTLLAVVICKDQETSSRGEGLHLALVMACALFFMMNHGIFKYNNMQYEIREAIITYGIFVWFAHWTDCLVLKD